MASSGGSHRDGTPGPDNFTRLADVFGADALLTLVFLSLDPSSMTSICISTW